MNKKISKIITIIAFFITTKPSYGEIVARYNHNDDRNIINNIGTYIKPRDYNVKGISYQSKDYSHYEVYGIASWYGHESMGMTANGEIFDPYMLTGASRDLPLPSIVRVTNILNNKEVIIKINDRGPFPDDKIKYPGGKKLHKLRVIDVSQIVARLLGFYYEGFAPVKVELLTKQTEEIHKLICKTNKRYDYYHSQYKKTKLKKERLVHNYLKNKSIEISKIKKNAEQEKFYNKNSNFEYIDRESMPIIREKYYSVEHDFDNKTKKINSQDKIKNYNKDATHQQVQNVRITKKIK